MLILSRNSALHRSAWSKTSWLLPDAGNHKTTLGTSAIFETVLKDVMPGAPDEQFSAFWTTGVRAVAVNIAFIDIVQTHFARNGTRSMESLRRRARLVLQLEIRMEGSEVQRHVRAEMGQDPF